MKLFQKLKRKKPLSESKDTLNLFPELRDVLNQEWIHSQDVHAIFAGWLPLEPYNSNWGYVDKKRRYIRIATGKEETPNDNDFAEMDCMGNLYGEVDLVIKTRGNAIDGNGNAEIRVREAFKAGLMYGVPFIKELHSAAVKKGLIARDPSPKPDYSPGPWEYVEQERQINYDWPLKKILLAYYEARFPIPSATQVLLDWRENMPQGISKVSEDGFSYLNLNLEEKTCMKRSLQEAIDRRTKLATTWPD
ncbi:MAG: hypothetical protein ACJZ8R_00075 [Pseudohongiellaceae bacterium]